MNAGPSLPDPCACLKPGPYRDGDGLIRCWWCGRLTAAAFRPPWAHRRTAD